MHSAPRARGGIGWFGWLLIIIGLCATVFNLALYYKITHPNGSTTTAAGGGDDGDSSSESPSPDSDASAANVAVSMKQNVIDRNRNAHQQLEAGSPGAGSKNSGADEDGAEAAAARKRRYRHHHHHQHHEGDEDGSKQKKEGKHAADEAKQQQADEENPHHHHRHRQHQHHHKHHHAGEEDDSAAAGGEGEGDAATGGGASSKNKKKATAIAPIVPSLNSAVGDAEKQKMWDNQLKLIQEDDKKKHAAPAGGHHHHLHRHHHHQHHGGGGSEKEDQKEDQEQKKGGGDEEKDGGGDDNKKHHHQHHQHQHQHRKAHGEGGDDEEGNKNAGGGGAGGENNKQDHHHDRHHHDHHHQHQHHNKGEDDASEGGDKKNGEQQQHQQEKGESGAALSANTDKKKAADDGAPPLSAKSKKLHDMKQRKAQRKRDLQHKRDAFHISDTSAFSATSYESAVTNFLNWTSKKQSIEQSSNHFEDIIEQPNMGVLLPDDGDGFFDDLVAAAADGADDARVEGEGEGEEEEDGASSSVGEKKKKKKFFVCDPDDSEFTPAKDRRCIAYLRNPRNWVSIKVMSSILSTGRTIKFKVFLRNPKYTAALMKSSAGGTDVDDDTDGGNNNNANNKKDGSTNNIPKYISAIIKISQKKFLLEPASEVEAFHTDRFLRIRRVPPVVWAPMPLKYLQAACGTMSAFYSGWFKQFVQEYEGARALLSRHGGPKRLNVSIQLWMNDVHDADTTSIKPSIAYEKYLQCYKSSSSSSSSTDNKSSNKKSKYEDPTQWTTLKNASLAGLTDISMFDYVIGNSDRWFGHNMFVIHGKNKDSPTDPMPKFLFLDQGSSFYSRTIPAEIIYHRSLSDQEKQKVKSGELSGPSKDDANTRHDLCRFRRSTAMRILEVTSGTRDESGDYYHVMRNELPRGLFKVASPSLLKASRSRLQALGRMIEDCRKKCGDAEVFMWD